MTERHAATENPFSWRKPAPLGWPVASDEMLTIAAPLLAGASITLLGVVIEQRDVFRWADPLLLALVLTVIFMIVAMVWGVGARGHLYSRNDLQDWWGPLDMLPPELNEELIREQQSQFARWLKGIRLAMRCFNLGLVLLAVSGILALIPPDHEATPVWRWTAAGAVAATVVGIGVVRAWPGVRSRAWPGDRR
ncbi:hypothetical protein V7793_02545 [Streptomyces sp. KLMMK]|uniref:hypothetical protein n=1 Tax=Streptomyces sp. KLMMK TaxID=3109353 RepID=UPI002FFE2C89